MSASATRENARKKLHKAQPASIFDLFAPVISLCEQFAINSRFGGGCADLP